jgi:hypothetical protein
MSKFIPKKVSRFGSRSVLKARKHSPTILVVAGVVGFGVTIVAAVKATPKANKVVAEHKAQRTNIGPIPSKGTVSKDERKDAQVQVLELYYNTGLELSKVYGPTIMLGTLSAASVLYGHKILNARHAATMAAYSGLMDQFNSYRGRVRKTLGEKAEQDIYMGAHGEYVEDSDHPGEYKLKPVFADGEMSNDSRFVWFNDKNPYFKLDPEINMMHLNGVQAHMNQLLQVRGHLMLNEVKDALGLPRTPDGNLLGWVLGTDHESDRFVDFGHTSIDDPDHIAFKNAERPDVLLVFNVDGIVYDLI